MYTRRRGAWLALVTLAAGTLFVATHGAHAHPFDTWGFGSRSIGMGGGATATASDVDGVYYNPATTVRSGGFVVGVGFLLADDALEVNGRDASLATTSLLQVGLAAPLPLGEALKDRLFFAVAVVLPSTGLYDIDQRDDEAIAFPMWGARNRRLVLSATLAGRITDWLSLGAGVALLPDVQGSVHVNLLSGGGENATRVQVDYDLGLVAGVLLEPLEWLAFGLTYRMGHATEVDLPVEAEVLSGVPAISARVVAPAYALPHEVAFGFQFKPSECLILGFDVTWYDYSQFAYSSPSVTAFDADGEVIRQTVPAAQRMSDTWAVRLGGEWRALEWLAVRAGYGYVPTPFPAQRGASNLLDAHRSVISLGLGFDIPRRLMWEGVERLAFDIHGQLHALSSRAVEKQEIMTDNPGYPTISLAGVTWSVGLTLTAVF